MVTQTITTKSGGPLSIAVDSTTHDVYVPGVFAGTISVINGDKVVRTIEFEQYMDFPRYLAVDSTTHALYVTHIGVNTVSVIHGSATTQTLYVTEPETPEVDSATHAVYVPSRKGSVSVIRDPSNRDFTSDGRTDVLARDASGALWLYPTSGAGGWLPPGRVGQGWNSMTSIVAGGDFNSDGHADVLASDDGGGALWLYPGDGAGDWYPRLRVGQGWQSMTAIVAQGTSTVTASPTFWPETKAGRFGSTPGTGPAAGLPGFRSGRAGTS